MKMLRVIFSVVMVLLVEQAASQSPRSWGYRRNLLPNDWSQDFPKCLGVQQSPINIETENTLRDRTLRPVVIKRQKLRNYRGNREVWEIKNTGTTVELAPKSHRFRFMAENVIYELVQMHFHWRGSEHTLNGDLLDAEVHLVHRNLNETGKFGVLGFFLQETEEDNKDLEPIIQSLDRITQAEARVNVDSFRLSDLIPFEFSKYYRYSGSLTTPACDEVVQWFVIQEPILSISNEQILDFQTVEDADGRPILTNSRPIQRINQRFVRRSFEVDTPVSDPRQAPAPSPVVGSRIEFIRKLLDFITGTN